MDISFIFDGIYNSIAEWFLLHGARVLMIIVAAAIVNYLLRLALSRKGVIPSVIDNIPRPKYKDVISHFARRRIQTVINAVKDALSFVICLVAAVTILPEFGVNVAPIIAGLGLAGLAIGLAAKDMLTDFLAGFFIIVEGELNIGDKVKVADVTGNVMAVSLRRTILQDGKGAIYIIPNREIKTIKRHSGLKTKENKN